MKRLESMLATVALGLGQGIAEMFERHGHHHHHGHGHLIALGVVALGIAGYKFREPAE